MSESDSTTATPEPGSSYTPPPNTPGQERIPAPGHAHSAGQSPLPGQSPPGYGPAANVPASAAWPGSPGYVSTPNAGGFGQAPGIGAPGYGQVPGYGQMPGYGPIPVPRAGQRGIGWIIGTVAAAVIAVVAIVVAVLAFAGSSDQRDTIARQRQTITDRDAARTAACDFASTVSNYDYNSLDAYFTAVRTGATGSLLQEFSSAETALRGTMTQTQTHSKSESIRCGVASADNAKAEVLVALSQSISNLTKPQPTTTQITLVMTMERQPDGRWLASKLDGQGLPK
ncbi:hypothetical protein [Nocardia sp. NPDC052566]|uniref:hypothetical protein n=1 Tax=Nocardia sp. NPDC052566 TaxID=3364330 RepID=UPI0037C6E1B3